MINIVSLHPQNLYAFHESWHTHEDNLSVIDKNTLHAVGNTMLHVIYYEAAGKF
jgi:aminopeptidase-like protein